MKKRNYFGLTIIMTMILTGGFVSGRRVRTTVNKISVQGLPEHGLNLVGPADSSYDQMIESLVSDNPDAGTIQALRPYSVFVKNTSGRAVVACLLRWEFVRADGKVAAETTGFVATWRLMNQDPTEGGGTVIRPKSTRFFPPSNLEVFQGGDDIKPTPPDITRERTEADYVRELTARFGHYTAVEVSLDGAFFEDGTFVGPDTTDFFSHVEALRNARYDVYAELSAGLEQGKSAGEIFRHAESLVRGTETRSDSAPLYDRTKGSVAREILKMREKAGDRETLQWVKRSLRAPRVELKRHGSLKAR